MSDELRDYLRIFPRLLLAFCLSIAAFGAWAEDDQIEDDAEDQTEEEAADLGRIEVTGSLLKREDFTSTSPVQIVNAETQAQVGQLEIADILQNSTVASGTTQLNNQFNGFVVQGGTGVQSLDLRGLGSNRTLVLLNGRRPGGSGTRGQTQALDLATLPEIAVQRAEFVLDGSSSIYGSDAIAGVANIITRRSVDGFEFQAMTEISENGGGDLYRIAAIKGWNFDKGSATLSAQWQKREELTIGDRDFLGCPQDIFYDSAGNRIDREDRSIDSTGGFGCDNLYADTILDHWNGGRLVPSPDGVVIGPMPGYRPRANGRYDDPEGEAYYEDQLDFDFTGSEHAMNRMERLNIYATLDYTFDFWGGVDWDADFLYSNRNTKAENWRQFFPVIGSAWAAPYGFGYANDPDWNPEIELPLGQPVIPYSSNAEIDVDYYYFTTGLEGMLPTDSYWSWQVYATYSHSDGDYSRNSILTSRSGDWTLSDSAPLINYYDPGILNGSNMQALIDVIGVEHTGNTVYEQFQATAILAGDLFEMPAGTLGAAFGVEYRDFSIDDQPSAFSTSGDLWGESSALVTKGSNDVIEAFAEIEVPLLAGITGIEELTLSLSARAFDYKEGGSDTVWKAGLRWNITPTFMLRGTAGTSYRAPALFELFLGDETGFQSQLAIDPCIDWGESTNEKIRTNCAAEGIPEDYTGLGSSAVVISGGGAGNLEPETSDAYTFGLVWTPEFTDLSIALDYIDIEVNNQIADLGASAIVSGCYNANNFPNTFCDLFTRAPSDDPTFPYNILEVNDAFINVNEQRYKGVDLNLVWGHDLSFGQLEVALQSTWNLENVQRLFDPDEVEGFDTTDYVGTIGSPDFVSNFRTTLNWQDWRFNYYLQYVSETDDSIFVDEETTYFGFDPAFRDITMDTVFYHNISVIYQRDEWDLLVGINNLLDEEPDTISDIPTRNRRGNVPVSATQYDLLGRRYFVRLNYRF